jgi:ATP/maltotriose-dependent transcriptional regulator MalT
LVLVSAPAGFGKTTLLAEWLAARPGPRADERPAPRADERPAPRADERLAARADEHPGPRADERLAAWLSLDRGDNDPASFWAYVIAALRTVASGVGESALALLDEPQPPAIETMLTTLLNDLGAAVGEIVLVLDDYHVIDASDVQDGMAFLLDICLRGCMW